MFISFLLSSYILLQFLLFISSLVFIFLVLHNLIYVDVLFEIYPTPAALTYQVQQIRTMEWIIAWYSVFGMRDDLLDFVLLSITFLRPDFRLVRLLVHVILLPCGYACAFLPCVGRLAALSYHRVRLFNWQCVWILVLIVCDCVFPYFKYLVQSCSVCCEFVVSRTIDCFGVVVQK